MIRLFVLICCAIFLNQDLHSQDTLFYQIGFPNAVHHEAEVSITFENPEKEAIELKMSNASPGRYSRHEFARNVYNLRAVNSDGKQLAIERIATNGWRVSEADDKLTIQYTLYGNFANGTYTGIDSDFANLNIPASCIWIHGKESNPIKLKLNIPDPDWKIATQMKLLDSSKHVYFAPDLQYFMDSPIIASDLRQINLSAELDIEANINMRVAMDA